MTNVTTKELNYVKDYLSWELYMAKLCHQHAEQMSDEGFGRIVDDAGRIHQQNYHEIYNYLESL